MLIYELYEQNLDSYSGTYIGDTRVGLFVNQENAMAFKKKWEKQWIENGKTCKSHCYMDSKPELLLKVLETND